MLKQLVQLSNPQQAANKASVYVGGWRWVDLGPRLTTISGVITKPDQLRFSRSERSWSTDILDRTVN